MTLLEATQKLGLDKNQKETVRRHLVNILNKADDGDHKRYDGNGLQRSDIATKNDKNEWQITDLGFNLLGASIGTSEVPQTTSSKEKQTTTEAPHEVEALVEMLRQELELKNKQIEALTDSISQLSQALGAAQALHAGTIQQQLEAPQDEPKRKRGFFRRVFRG